LADDIPHHHSAFPPGRVQKAHPFAEAPYSFVSNKRLAEDEGMELVIPDGAQIHITIANAPLLALPNETAPRPATPKSGGRFLKGVVAGVLVLGAFQAGRIMSHGGDPIPPAQASIAEQAPPVLPRAAAAADQQEAAEIPPAFREKLTQPPQVAPPPGQAAVVAPGTPTPANPFGLHE
jgi:hypothetical protein